MTTLHTQKVPSTSILTLLTIIACNVDNPREFGWYRLQHDTSCHGIPRGHHTFFCFGRLFTYGTTTVVSSQLTETVPMDGMSTGHLVTCTSTAEQIFLTNGTVGFVLSDFAVVIVVEGTIDAHATIMTVLKVFCPSDATKAAIGTMVRTFFVRHPQIAGHAMVGPELHPTVDTVVGLARLSREAFPTNHLPNSKSINRMMRIFGIWRSHVCERTWQGRTSWVSSSCLLNSHLGWENRTVVVTNPTTKGCSATWSNHGTLSIIMTTQRTCQFGSLGLLIRDGDNLTARTCLLLLLKHVRRWWEGLGRRMTWWIPHTPTTGSMVGFLRRRRWGCYCATAERVTPSIHELLNRTTTFHIWETCILQDCLNRSTTLAFFIFAHASTALHRLMRCGCRRRDRGWRSLDIHPSGRVHVHHLIVVFHCRRTSSVNLRSQGVQERSE
mmetsp:Transcript_47674/g.70956  ORF Transcript_47674/g.70956 Transcript_47674/m.70956 type:complete len:439 (+) Transcript_47674:395-1711(+)